MAVWSTTPASSDESRARYVALLAAALYAVSGVVVLATMWLLPGDVGRSRIGLLASSGIVVGAALPLLPWRWWRWMPGVVVVLGQVHLAVAGWVVPGAVEHYLPLYVLSYLYMGMALPPRTAVYATPMTIASYAIATSSGRGSIVNFLVTLPVAVVGAEVLSRLLRHQQRQFDEVAKVLDATKQLVGATSVDGAALVIGELTEDLLGSDSVIVLVADTEVPSRFVSRRSSEALAALGVISVDIDAEQTGVGVAVRSAQTVMVSDAASSQIVSRRYVEATGAESIAFVPLFDAGTPVGALVVIWRRPGVQLTGSAAQVIELVAAEAGPILGRLRDTDRLNWEAETDPLTGLANRRTFNRALDQSAAGDALMMIDLDRFKRVNDLHGHAIGDDVLRAMAACLTRAAREGDTVARFGGEEFAAILPGAGAEGVRSFLGRLRGQWEATPPLATFSAGFAVRGTDETTLLTLGRADAALYEAKARGRNIDVEATSA